VAGAVGESRSRLQAVQLQSGVMKKNILAS